MNEEGFCQVRISMRIGLAMVHFWRSFGSSIRMLYEVSHNHVNNTMKDILKVNLKDIFHMEKVNFDSHET